MFRKKYAFKTIISMTCAIAMAVGLLSGCGTDTKKDDTASSATATTKTEEVKKPTEFKIVLGYSDEVPAADNPVLLALNKLANANINIEWTPLISINDKFNVLMASNQLPDVLQVPDPKMTVYVNGARAGMFWDIGNLVKQSPNLKNIQPMLLANVATDGKTYMIPRERDIKRKMITYRADWAKKANLKAPDSIENIYAMAKAFANGDFDGNGKNDTIGFGVGTVTNAGTEIDCFDELVTAFGGFNRWGLKDGKVTPAFMTTEYMNTLKWMKKMYDEKLISPDFAITKTTQLVTDFVDKEKMGLYLNYGIPGLTDPVLLAKQKADPKVVRGDIFGYTFIKGSDGKDRIPAETGVYGGFAFPKTTVKDEARLKELLNVFDKLYSKEGQILLNNGIEGVHFNLVKVGSETGAKLIDAAVNKKDLKMGQLGVSGLLAYTAADDEINLQLVNTRRKYEISSLIPDVTAALLSDSYSQNKANLDNLISDAFFKFIMGNINEEQWNQVVAKWRTSGGDKVIEEYTAAYNKSNSK